MKNLVKLSKPSELKALRFHGLEITEVKAGNGGTDFRGVEVKDTATGTMLRIELGPYSDLNVFTEAQPVFKTAFIAKGKLGVADVSAQFDAKEKAEAWRDEQSIQECVIVEQKIESDE